jgi:hypothetical protein
MDSQPCQQGGQHQIQHHQIAIAPAAEQILSSGCSLWARKIQRSHMKGKDQGEGDRVACQKGNHVKVMGSSKMGIDLISHWLHIGDHLTGGICWRNQQGDVHFGVTFPCLLASDPLYSLTVSLIFCHTFVAQKQTFEAIPM